MIYGERADGAWLRIEAGAKYKDVFSPTVLSRLLIASSSASRLAPLLFLLCDGASNKFVPILDTIVGRLPSLCARIAVGSDCPQSRAGGKEIANMMKYYTVLAK